MKKVLLITGTWPPIRCGVGNYSAHFYAALTQLAKTHVSVLTSQASSQAPAGYRVADWRLQDLPSIVREVQKAQPDIVHLQYPTTAYEGKSKLGITFLPWLLRLKHYKTVVTLHEYYGASLLGKLRMCLMMLPVQQIAVSNAADYNVLPKILQRKAQQIHIGSNIPIVRPDTKRVKEILASADLSPTKQTAIFFGLLHPNKNLEPLIACAQSLGKNVQILLVLDAQDDTEYAQKILKLAQGAHDDGQPIGIVSYLNDNDLSVMLQHATFFVLPQAAPALTAKSGSAIAASLHGCVVIALEPQPATLAEPFVSDKNCYLLPTMSTESLSQTLSNLAARPETVTKLSQQARTLASYFDWEVIAKKFMAIYEQL